MVFNIITSLLTRSSTPKANFPPTELYNEGWMLRLLLDWLASNPGLGHDLDLVASDKWYSEALLPSPFAPRFRGDRLGESRTHADGVIGDFIIGTDSKADLSLLPGASRFIVVEAKMFSKLSSGVKNSSFFNQAARNVACITEVIKRAGIEPASMENIGFFLVAPDAQIKAGVFAEHMNPRQIRNTVSLRVSQYQDAGMDLWFVDRFLPTLEKIRIREISWEELINLIGKTDPDFGVQIDMFYDKCLEYNQKGKAE